MLVIAGGKLLIDGTLDSLRRQAGGKRRLIIDLAQPSPLHPDDAPHVLQHDDARLVLQFDPEQISGPQLISVVTQRYPVRDLFIEAPEIEELVAEIYRGIGLPP